MNYSITYIAAFAKELKRLGKKYRSMSQDYARLLEELHANLQAGVSLGGVCGRYGWRSAARTKAKATEHV